MNDTTTIKRLQIPNNRGVDRQTRAARIRAARTYAIHSIPRIAIMLGQWDRGAIVSAQRHSEDAVEVVGKHDALVKRIEDMRDFCEGADGNKRPHPANVARLCRDMLEALGK
ncbi:MAG: hypothetical protein ACJ75S_06955 [Solirubrobacterales bacterium]